MCGLSYKAIIHKASGGGIVCELLGGSYFSFKNWKKYLLIILLFIFFPVLIYIFSCLAIGCLIGYVVKIGVKRCFRNPINSDSLKLPAYLKAPLQILGFVLIVTTGLVVIITSLSFVILFGSALFIISIVPMYVILIYGFVKLTLRVRE